MHLDLRQPTVIIAGAFNPAIFSPPWIANVLYGIAEGEEISGLIVQDLVQLTQKPYIRDVGILAEAGRLSIFVDKVEPEALTLAESVVKRAAEALPHTPVVGFGLNFAFVEAEPEAEVVDRLKQGDQPEKLGELLNSSLASAIRMEDGTLLNLSRGLAGGELSVSFNFHSELSNLGALADEMEGLIDRRLQQSKKILADLYDFDTEQLNILRALNN